MNYNIKDTFNEYYTELGLDPSKNPALGWKAPDTTPPPNRPFKDIHNDWVSDFSSSGLSPESIHNIHGEEQFWNKPVKPITPDPSKPSQTLSEEDKKKISFYDDLNTYFKGNIPSDLKEWPPKFPGETLNTAFAKYSEPKEKHTDYDQISKERSEWLALFPSPLTPSQVKKKYDEPSGVLTDDEKFKLKNYDTIDAERIRLLGVDTKLAQANLTIIQLQQQLASFNKPSGGGTITPTPVPISPSGFGSGKVWDAYAHLVLDPGVSTNFKNFHSWAANLSADARLQIRHYYRNSLNNMEWLKARMSMSYFA